MGSRKSQLNVRKIRDREAVRERFLCRWIYGGKGIDWRVGLPPGSIYENRLKRNKIPPLMIIESVL